MTIHSSRAACELFWWSLSMSSISCRTCDRVASQRQHACCSLGLDLTCLPTLDAASRCCMCTEVHRSTLNLTVQQVVARSVYVTQVREQALSSVSQKQLD